MNLKSLNYFVVVLEKGSISAAAKHCYIAQPSISAAISQLESELNTQLFHRHGKGITPTDAGMRLYPLARRLLNESRAIQSLFAKQEIQVPFRLGLIRSLGVQRMSMLLKEFTAACPDMDLTLVEPTEDSDARIITTSDLGINESFLPMWHDTYVLAIPPSMSLGLKSAVRLEDLHQQPFIHRAPCEALTSLQQLLDMEGIKLQVRARIQTVEYAVGLVAAGLGIALVPAIPALLEQQDIVFRPLADIELKRTVGLAMPLGQAQTPQQKQLSALCNLFR
ncbi:MULTISPECIES: LysR family transcriptional regulator [Shewanella]|uniref:LysR family transcriptional regulator n=2 Tax=Shewanella TaxID=22 RepID=A0A975ALF3_9GAMM|nr:MULTISPECIES: LysR family transcriptional regulator [Shewanella]QSX30706.1 LysR family transcriptional regulator [Shewanella cyperi]QSX37920.1 LysR family transcriptional regulator [Shewanella sedimentimangrovi]QSX41484.1 LysR family transcriptional regulator [Shewanella cyperi]